MKKWTDEEKAFVKHYAGHLTDDQLTEELSTRRDEPISKAAVRKMRQRLGVAKKCGRGVCALDVKNIIKS